MVIYLIFSQNIDLNKILASTIKKILFYMINNDICISLIKVKNVVNALKIAWILIKKITILFFILFI